MNVQHFSIVGGGLSGALMAVYLRRAGHAVDVFERRPDPRTRTAIEEEQSVNVALSVRGWSALTQAGFDDEILSIAVPMDAQILHPVQGAPDWQPFRNHPDGFLWSISRRALNATLLTAAESHGARLHFNHVCRRVDPDRGLLEVEDEQKQIRTISNTVVIGADGADSTVRTCLTHDRQAAEVQRYLTWGYKELHMPSTRDGWWPLHPQAMHLWPRERFILTAQPNNDGSFTCTLYMSLNDDDLSFKTLNTPGAIQNFFREAFHDALPHLPGLVEEFMRRPTRRLRTVACCPWHIASNVVLIGDAAHAVVPFCSQGMNAALEDCTLLAQAIRDSKGDLEDAFTRFEATRKPDTDALARISLHQLEEMRGFKFSTVQRWKEHTHRALERLFPSRFPSLYSMVALSRLSYSDARRRSRRQAAILDGVIAGTVLGATALMAARVAGHRASCSSAAPVRRSAGPVDGEPVQPSRPAHPTE